MTEFTDFDSTMVVIIRIKSIIECEHVIKRYPNAFEFIYLGQIYGNRAKIFSPEMFEHELADAFLTSLDSEAQTFSGLDSIGSAPLHVTGLDLIAAQYLLLANMGKEKARLFSTKLCIASCN